MVILRLPDTGASNSHVALLIPVFDAKGNRQGKLVATLNLAYLIGLYTDLKPGASYTIQVLDNAGKDVAGTGQGPTETSARWPMAELPAPPGGVMMR